MYYYRHYILYIVIYISLNFGYIYPTFVSINMHYKYNDLHGSKYLPFTYFGENNIYGGFFNDSDY